MLPDGLFVRVVESPLCWASLLAWLGMWMLLPRASRSGRGLGTAVTLVALVLFGSQLPRLVGWLDQSVFWTLSALTVVSCAACITARNPVYSAIWFALALAGTGGLLFFQGAQFLAVATIVVYAGAIVVTFLFVLMLAQPEGHAQYDRLSWEAPVSAATGALVVGILAATLSAALQPPDARGTTVGSVAMPSERDQDLLADDHVARFGAELFGRHLVAVEVAGVLLLVALVGAAGIVFTTETQRE
jgi:NADH-quinone oxidoreductase subunit J